LSFVFFSFFFLHFHFNSKSFSFKNCFMSYSEIITRLFIHLIRWKKNSQINWIFLHFFWNYVDMLQNMREDIQLNLWNVGIILCWFLIFYFRNCWAANWMEKLFIYLFHHNVYNKFSLKIFKETKINTAYDASNKMRESSYLSLQLISNIIKYKKLWKNFWTVCFNWERRKI
jgi:hypothetical protein